MSYSKQSILCNLLLVFLTGMDVLAVDHRSLFPNAVANLTHVRNVCDQPGQYGEYQIVQIYNSPQDNWMDYPSVSIDITKFNPQWEVVTRDKAELYQQQDGLYTFQVQGWPVGLAESNDQFVLFGTSKNNYAITISVSRTESSDQAQDLAAEAFSSILPKIPEPPSSSSSIGPTASTEKPGESKKESGRTEINVYRSHREMLKAFDKEQREKESRQKMDQAWSDFEKAQNQAIAAANKTDAALGNIYREGARLANAEGNSVAHRVEIVPPSTQIILFREADHRFGIGVANRSSHQLVKVEIGLFVHTNDGKEKIGKKEISSILAGDVGNASFDISYKKLFGMVDKMTSTDVIIEAKYKIRWNKAYFSSETKTRNWINAINPSQNYEAVLAAEAAATLSPEVSIDLVNETGRSLNTQDIFPEKYYFVKFIIKPPEGQSVPLAAYGEPGWSPWPKDLIYSGWMDVFDQRTPYELQKKMDKFNQRSNSRFSGKLGKSSVYFYARFKSPKTDDNQPFQITLPVKYSSDANLEGHEEGWIEKSFSANFVLTQGRAQDDLSERVKMNVTEISRQDQVHVALTLPGGQIAGFSGTIIWMQPTDKWWAKDLKRWTGLNNKLQNMDEDKVIEAGGKEQMMGDVAGAYDQQLGQALTLYFSADNIVSAKSEDAVVIETGKAVAAAFIPMSGILLPVLETASVWYPRENEEKEMVAEASRVAPENPFLRGTLFTSPNDLLGDRIFFKVIDNTLYAIKLGETSF